MKDKWEKILKKLKLKEKLSREKMLKDVNREVNIFKRSLYQNKKERKFWKDISNGKYKIDVNINNPQRAIENNEGIYKMDFKIISLSEKKSIQKERDSYNKESLINEIIRQEKYLEKKLIELGATPKEKKDIDLNKDIFDKSMDLYVNYSMDNVEEDSRFSYCQIGTVYGMLQNIKRDIIEDKNIYLIARDLFSVGMQFERALVLSFESKVKRGIKSKKDAQKAERERHKDDIAKHPEVLKMWDELKPKWKLDKAIKNEIAEKVYGLQAAECEKKRRTIENILRKNKRIK